MTKLPIVSRSEAVRAFERAGWVVARKDLTPERFAALFGTPG